MYNFLEDFLWAAAPSQSQFWSYVKSLVWHPISCCDTEMKHTICLCLFTRNTVILPHDLHSFNLTSFEAKTVEIPHLLHNFEAKTVVLPRFLQSFKAKVVVSPHFFTFSTQFEAKTVICLHFLHTCEATSWYYHTFCTVWNLKLRYDHMFWIVFEPNVWYYHQFFIVSLEIKPMMFLHLLRSFGSKTVKLRHILTFLLNFT